jgi:hypothetical protein
MFPNWTGWKTVKLVLSLGATLVGSLAAAGVISPEIAHVAGITDGALLSIVIALSGTNAGPAMAAKS